MSQPKSKIIVVDSGAFIKNAKIEDYAEEVYTTQAVVKEIRDRQTRTRLQVLPYSLNFKEPNPKSVAHVSEIAKKSGDFRSLSATDIRVVALTFELHEQCKGLGVSQTPACGTEKTVVEKVPYRDAFGDIDSADDLEGSDEFEPESEDDAASDAEEEEEGEEEEEEEEAEKDVEEAGMVEEEVDEKLDEEAAPAEVLEKVVGEPKSQAMEVSEDDKDDWVTADNFSEHDFNEDFTAFKSAKDEAIETPTVCCLTTDFAMQNVLLRMGLGIRSVDGLIVRSPKSFVLWCYACNKHTLDQTKQFCPSCGNKCLRKVTASIDDEGKVNLHFARKFQWRNKGKNRQTDPFFRGGKYSNNRMHSEDQPMPHQRPSKKALQRLDPEASSADCPFANRDLSSRAAKLGMNQRFRGGRRK